MSKKYLFGVKYLVLYDLTTFIPKGIFEVIGGVEVGREIEQLFLTGGHKDSPYAVEAGEPSNSLTATIKEYPDFAFSAFENAELTQITSETLGFVDTIANKKGTSVVSATVGIASVAIKTGEGDDIPSGFIVIKAKTADTVTVYHCGDLASGRVPIVDELPVLADDVTIPGTGGTVDLTGYGITITGGSGVIAMTVGDTAYFDCRPANTATTKIKVGKDSGVAYYGVLLVYPRNSAKEQAIVRFPNVAVVGMGFAANTREFSEFEQPMTPLIDDTEEILYEIVRTKTA